VVHAVQRDRRRCFPRPRPRPRPRMIVK
jgi:hypothetical protein